MSTSSGPAMPSLPAAKGGWMARASRWVEGGRGDRFAMGLSGLCALHCAASLFFLAFMASAGAALLNPAIHEVGLAVAILLGLILLITGARRHGQIRPLIIGGMGLVTMAFALTLPHDAREVVATLIGVTMLALSHGMNRRAGRRAA